MKYLSLVLLGFALAFAQDATNPEFQSPRTASYYLAPVNGGAVAGYLQVNEVIDGGTRLIVSLQNITEGNRYALALFEGDCGPDRALVETIASVSNVPGDPYTSITDSSLTFDTVTSGNHFLYVYNGTDTAGPLAACGEVGQGANASGLQTPAVTEAQTSAAQAQTNQAQQTAPSATNPEFVNPRTASYYLAPVNGLGVEANMQVNEVVGGGTRIVVSLSRDAQPGEHAVVLYQGNCGPDRAEVAQLSRIDSSDGDPYVSITRSTLDFDTVTNGDHFAYIFQDAPGSAVVACGEVGVGANR